MEIFVIIVRGQIKILKRQMLVYVKLVLQKLLLIKFKLVFLLEVKLNELSLFLKVVLGVSVWLYFNIIDYYYFLDFLFI